MSYYVPTGITEEEHRTRSILVQEQLLELRRAELAAKKKDRFWSALTTIVTVGIPLATFLGWQAYFKSGGK